MTPLDHQPESVVYARRNVEMKQAHAAAQLHISASYLSEIEKGTRNANLSLLRRMAEIYHCPLVTLLRKADVYADAS